MEKNLFIFNFKKWPRTCSWLLLIIFSFEIANSILDDRFYKPPFDGLRMKVKNQIAQEKNNNFDIYLLGDCFVLNGMKPNIIEQKTRMSCFNFATHSDQTILASYVLLKNYLKVNKKKPKYLIISFLPRVVEFKKQQMLSEKLPFFYDFRDGNFFNLSRELGFFNAVKLMIPTLKHQEFYQKQLFLKDLIDRGTVDSFKQSVFEHKGYYPWRVNTIYNGNVLDAPIKYTYRFALSPFFDSYIRKILDLCKQHHITVLYVMRTMPPDVFLLDKEYQLTHTYKQYIMMLKNQYSQIRLLDPQNLLKNRDNYSNYIHLNGKGARIISEYLGDYINQYK